MTFSGRLDSSTVAALIELEQMPAGHLAGDFTAHILRDRPWESSASGRLSGERIVLPWKAGVPLQIDALSLSAEGTRISVQSSRLRLADMALSSRGTLAFGKDGLDVNMEFEADRLDWKSLERITGDEKTAAPAAGRSASAKMPVRGIVKISAREFVYDPYTDESASCGPLLLAGSDNSEYHARPSFATSPPADASNWPAAIRIWRSPFSRKTRT